MGKPGRTIGQRGASTATQRISPRGRLAAAVLLLSLTAACSGPIEDKPYRMTVILGREGSIFSTSLACGAEVEADEVGVDLDLAVPLRWAAAGQTALVRDVIADEPDAVLIAPVDEQAMLAPVRAMKRAGITVVEVGTHVADRSLAVAWVASDNREAGRLAAQAMARRMGPRGTVLVLGGTPGASSTAARVEAFRQEMQDDHPAVAVLDVRHTGGDREHARHVVEETLAEHPDLTGIFSIDPTTALGAAEALRGAGQATAITHVGIGAGSTQIDQLEEGGVDVIIAQEPYVMGQRGVQEAVHALDGEPVQERVTTDLSTISRQTLERRHHLTYSTEDC